MFQEVLGWGENFLEHFPEHSINLIECLARASTLAEAHGVPTQGCVVDSQQAPITTTQAR
jgi:hypothetical protein